MYAWFLHIKLNLGERKKSRNVYTDYTLANNKNNNINNEKP